MHETALPPQNCILVSVLCKSESSHQAMEYLQELAFLAETYDLETIKTFTQRLEHPENRTYIGKGKVEEIRLFIEENPTDFVIFDDGLSSSQVRNLEKELQCTIMDRNALILEIFLKRAKTAQAKTQVELARYQYMLPRLTRMWSHLERQRGGGATRSGSGESQLESDKRDIRTQIDLLKEKLKKIELQGETQRKGREGIARVSLVGYTNVGKSTLMNLFAKADIFAENKLFATVDSTVRKVHMDGVNFLLADTVGFIRKLPHQLVECFKSTLEEVREADILLHVIDISHPSFEDQMEVVDKTLIEIKANDKPTILVFNKIDSLVEGLGEEGVEERIELLRQSYLSKSGNPAVFISATDKVNVDEFRAILKAEVEKIKVKFY
jgi:GTP-binding protein HflX